MPEEEPKIYGENLPEEEMSEAREALIEQRKEGAEPIKGEERKFRQDREVISFVSWAIEQEFQELGLGKPNLLTPERIHFLPKKVYDQKFPKAESSIFYAPRLHAAFIEVDKDCRPALYKSILHEAVHAASFFSLWADTEMKQLKDLRGGITAFHPHEEDHEHFKGLNEALTDFVTWKLMAKYEAQIKERFGFDLKKLGFKFEPGITETPPGMFYDDYMLVFDSMALKLSQRKRTSESIEDVFERFEKSLFTGKLLHLRDIDRTFGRGSLRFLAALGSATRNLPREEIKNKAIRFFETDDQAEKDKIASEVLNERERLRYFQGRKRSAEE